METLKYEAEYGQWLACTLPGDSIHGYCLPQEKNSILRHRMYDRGPVFAPEPIEGWGILSPMKKSIGVFFESGEQCETIAEMMTYRLCGELFALGYSARDTTVIARHLSPYRNRMISPWLKSDPAYNYPVQRVHWNAQNQCLVIAGEQGLYKVQRSRASA